MTATTEQLWQEVKTYEDILFHKTANGIAKIKPTTINGKIAHVL